MNIANKSHALGSCLGFQCAVLINFQGNKEYGLCFFVFCLYSICWAMDRKLIPNFSWQCYFIYHTFSLFCRQFLLRRYCASSVGSHCVTTAKSYHTVKIKASCWERFQKRYLFCLQRIVPGDTQTLTFYQWSRLQSLIRIGFRATTFCRFFIFFFFGFVFFLLFQIA